MENAVNMLSGGGKLVGKVRLGKGGCHREHTVLPFKVAPLRESPEDKLNGTDRDLQPKGLSKPRRHVCVGDPVGLVSPKNMQNKGNQVVQVVLAAPVDVHF